MKYTHDTRTFNIGTNPGGGEYVRFKIETLADMQQAFGLNPMKWPGNNSLTIYRRLTDNSYRTPSDGGPNPEWARALSLMTWADANPATEAGGLALTAAREECSRKIVEESRAAAQKSATRVAAMRQIERDNPGMSAREIMRLAREKEAAAR